MAPRPSLARGARVLVRPRFLAASLAALLAASLGATLATPLAAQVGHDPAGSPYRDIEGRFEASVYGGYLASERDPARVAPRSAPFVGGRFDAGVGGPLRLFLSAAHAFSQREVVNPSAPAATQRLGMREAPLTFLTAGAELALTGQRTYRGLAPSAQLGLGFVSDFAKVDVGGFRVGTPLAISVGGGVRWVPGGRYALRLDVVDHLYRIKYPEAYARPASGGAAVIGQREARSNWLHNAALTLGLTYRFVR